MLDIHQWPLRMKASMLEYVKEESREKVQGLKALAALAKDWTHIRHLTTKDLKPSSGLCRNPPTWE